MKILHTSDWHLGQSFMGRSRREEHSAFLAWLHETIVAHEIDLLLVSGDIFDTGTPPNYALELYYNFIRSLQHTSCRQLIVTAGNHDSVATLKAPRELLKAFRTEVVTGEEEEPVVVPVYVEEKLSAVVCAVPFLREGFVRRSLWGESVSQKELQLQEGIENFYRMAYERAKTLSGGGEIPIVAMGHLTTIGGQSGESEREIYVGGSLQISPRFFAEHFDYTALGHLHKSQRMGEGVYYSGSPIPLSFSEANGTKRVHIVTFEGREPRVERVEIPLFRALVSLRGKPEEIIEKLGSITEKDSWIEVHVDAENPYEANKVIRETAEEMELTLLAVRLERTEAALRADDVAALSLDELTPLEVFEKRMEMENIEDEALHEVLIERFKEVVLKVQDDENS